MSKMKKSINISLSYLLLVCGGVIMVYPLIWLFFASFKPSNEIFGTAALIPSTFSFDGYVRGWAGAGQYSFGVFYYNTFRLVLPVVSFTIISCCVVAYGFARFRFPFKRFFFAIMISTLMLPSSVMLVPRYIMFRDLGWLNTYLPFIVPSIFATGPFFIFLLVQFFRGIPKELDESAYIDGCNSLYLLYKIILPLSKPALFSVGLFQFMWTWNDFFQPLIYINSVSRYTLALGLRMSMDVSSGINWNNVLAMSFVTILPLIILFFFTQKYFVEGITTTGLKG